MCNKKQLKKKLDAIAKTWYLIAPVVVYVLGELETIFNKTCNWWLFGSSLLFLAGAQFAAKYFLENIDGGDCSSTIH